ncbi:MAG: type II secretion system protein GspN [Deferrisomatales bacterium]|nr:type II secretion system protein GspN [Deferrisomatales bacterium]
MRWISFTRGSLLRGAGYTLFTLGVFLFSLWRLLPYPELSRNLESRLLSEGIAARIEGLGPGAFPGVRARTVRLAPANGPEWGLDLHDAQVGFPLRSLVRGQPIVAVDARTLGGGVSARLSLGSTPRASLEWADVDLSRLRLPPALSELPLAGEASGQLEAEVRKTAPINSGGRTDITFQDVRIGAGKAFGFPVPPVGLGNGRLRLVADGGRLEVESAVFEGGDLGVELSGSVLLRPDPTRSLVNGVLSLRPDDQVSQDLALLFAIFPGARASDGRYTARIRGTLGAPRLLAR